MSILESNLTRAALAAALLASTAPALAVEPLDTFSVKLGGYASRFDTDVKVNGDGREGSRVDLNQDLGLDQDNTLNLLGVSWRPFEHHEFGAAYYRDDVSATQQLQRDITFNGVTYQTNATVRAHRDADIYELYYVWWTASHDTWALGPRLGVVWYSIELGIDLQMDANGNSAGAGLDRSVSGDVPAPAIGAGWRWTPAEDWRISADVGYFQADINDVDADVTYGRVGAEWFPWQRFGFWVDVMANKVDADLRKNDFNGSLDFTQEGARLGVVYRF